MRQTTAQERMDLLQEVNEAARDAMVEWCRRWYANGEPIHLIWQTDGTAVVEVDDIPAMRVQVEIAVSATEYEEATAPPNKPTGFILTRTWAEVPAGWFVQGPNGAWYEVMATRYEDDKQWVSLIVEGQRGEWPRDPAGPVKVKRGTAGPSDRDTALDALRAARISFTVLEDQTS